MFKASTISMENEFRGLTTKRALKNLYDEILTYHVTEFSKQGTNNWWKNAWNISSPYSVFSWTTWLAISILTTAICISSLIYGPFSYLKYGLSIFVLCGLSAAAVGWESYLRHNEFNNRIKQILLQIKLVENEGDWQEYHYPDLYAPNAPSVSLQWTIRDGKLINLPTILLTNGDHIVMMPGQQSPALCVRLERNDQDGNDGLMVDEVFGCQGHLYKLEQPDKPTLRIPLASNVYRVKVSPIISSLYSLHKDFLHRPYSYYNRASHFIFVVCLQQYLLVAIFITLLVMGFYRWRKYGFSLDGYFTELVLCEPMSVLVCTVPLMFPLVWIAFDIIGNAILPAFNLIPSQTNEANDDCASENTDGSHKICFDSKLFYRNLSDIICGHGATLTRTANLLHVLASISALCCVDKKGILSWPNPSAEKVFFLRESGENPNFSISSKDAASDGKKDNSSVLAEESTVEEVLEITRDSVSPWSLEFDDPHWRRFLPLLKPLGLAILLNTCNKNTHARYTRFCTHITCQSLFTKHLVPVTNRRCLCDLAKKIGFKWATNSNYNLQLQLCTYRNVGDIIKLDTKYMQTFFKRRKLKFPFPHMMAVVVEPEDEQTLQLFSQGTADVILDFCIDYWNGFDIRRLTPKLRKRVIDFYQRSSLTAYCTAFSYRPIHTNHPINAKSADAYIELPRTNPSTSALSIDNNCISPTSSIDNLKEEEENGNDEASTCFKTQQDQVFIGMVSMQYQALNDIVSAIRYTTFLGKLRLEVMVCLIEELEKACIRFVHFSKENELRSRVFSEKMGLESGWNCHISLLENDTRDDAMELSKPTSSNNDEGGQDENDSVQSETSSIDERVPFTFDINNRAKLPRGIENIRPHLKNIDNVPLLVSLFTDCTPDATREMISIMQEYGEVTCIIGSSANVRNFGMFLQADASVAIDPLYPQLCQQMPMEKSFSAMDEPMSPIQLAQLLNTIPCSLSLRRESPLPLYHLIMRARNMMRQLWNMVQFWLCCIAILTLIQLIPLSIDHRPLLTLGEAVWTTFLGVPLLSMSLIFSKSINDPSILSKAPDKDCFLQFSPKTFNYVIFHFGGKIFVAVTSVTCWYIYTNECYGVECSSHFVNHTTSLFLLILHIEALYTSVFYNEDLLWRSFPRHLVNVAWLIPMSILILTQVLLVLPEVSDELSYFTNLPNYFRISAIVSPFITLVIAELIKLREIKIKKRYQKRVRLEFGTKLGMNSPF